nr:MAG TPA: hypothetical protein [Bacteriophage sp.]
MRRSTILVLYTLGFPIFSRGVDYTIILIFFYLRGIFPYKTSCCFLPFITTTRYARCVNICYSMSIGK